MKEKPALLPKSDTPTEARPNTAKPLRQRHVELAQRVYEVAINAGLNAGDRMPEQLLAIQCNVSRTPIRRALQLLAEQGIATIDPDGGYRMSNISDTSTGQISDLPQTEEDELFKAILDDLAARRIPTSQTLAALQRRYEASRLTVQNTLQRLLEEQFVERAAGQRWLFKPMVVGSEATAQSYEFRILMEPAALLSPGFKADPVTLAGMRQSLEALEQIAEENFDIQLAERLDYEFHIMIARACSNPFFQDALLNHHLRRRNVTAGGGTNIFRMRQSVRELLHIIEQIERNQMELAADLMRAHLRLLSFGRPRVVGRSIPPMPQTMSA
ncbi:GntR family transcriptional regulator [Solimicrobium silvestre]|uniref:FCD domain n=1 Tax=Solimicrobium silvestre TaxID=2099400 RepID=A0A2S9GTV1_9BURK|nr:GntR family transcriptional regulator [Solimicrobium silvestre]PRC91157.1 FCD domain [Solimicrobium silvestre]